MSQSLEEHIKYNLEQLFEHVYNESLGSIELMPQSGSSRKYYRLTNVHRSVIGTYNADHRENIAFLGFSRHFHKMGLNVPEIIAESLKNNVYLQEDLGNTSLFDYLNEKRKKDSFPKEAIDLYKKVLEKLAVFQFKAHQGLDYSIAYPRYAFDKQSMLWDLNYFKHYFVRLSGVSFYEQDLEDDFNTLIHFLKEAQPQYFLYRDFQSRNIMLRKDEIFFIDYQGGRRGALQYDVASLLFDAKAAIPHDIRAELLDYYITQCQKHFKLDKKEFLKYYPGFVLIRIMQAFGAYGYRGFFERKQHFLQSIPPAVKNLQWILENFKLPVELPTLNKVFEQIIKSPNLKELEFEESSGLTVLINSFSYKRNIPLDNSGNGGGFVFDCRFLPNPGRIPEFKDLNGRDKEIIAYLENKPETHAFFHACIQMVEAAIENYLERDFTHLMISFGCTGGQHRSVYFADRLFIHLNKKYPARLKLRHIEQEISQEHD